MTDAFDPVGKRTEGSDDVMSAVEESDTHETFVVADITRDDAWVTTATENTVAVSEWR